MVTAHSFEVLAAWSMVVGMTKADLKSCRRRSRRAVKALQSGAQMEAMAPAPEITRMKAVDFIASRCAMCRKCPGV